MVSSHLVCMRIVIVWVVVIVFIIQVLSHKIFMSMEHDHQSKHQLKINKVSHIGQNLQQSPDQSRP